MILILFLLIINVLLFINTNEPQELTEIRKNTGHSGNTLRKPITKNSKCCIKKFQLLHINA